MVPRIRDMIEEYGQVAKGKVRVSISTRSWAWPFAQMVDSRSGMHGTGG